MDIRYLFRGILAGCCISIGGTIFLKVGGVAGAVLFAIGLIAVVSLKLNLFTGKAQFVWRPHFQNALSEGGYAWLAGILLANIIGCAAMALLVSTPEMQASAEAVITKRLANSAWMNGLLSIGCGFLMTLAVQGYARNTWVPLLFAVPAFILCGFPHCVADAFYICSTSCGYLAAHLAEVLTFYAAIVVGNFLGCNAYRLVNPAAVIPGANPLPAEDEDAVAS